MTPLHDAKERFESYVKPDESTGCLEWQGAIDLGYGRFWFDGRTLMAHRFAWELEVGPIPDGLQIDHLCRNRSCVNPEHMEPVTIGENVLRGEGLSARNARKITCINGHLFDEENTYITPKGNRDCKKCRRKAVRKWRARNGKKESAS